MKYVRVRLRQPDRMLHPMQQFIRDEDVVRYEELLTWNFQVGDDVEHELFYVEAPERDRYVAQLETVDSVRWYDLTPIDDVSFYLYVCQETLEERMAWRQAFAALDLVVVPPIVYDQDARFYMTIVGRGEGIETVFDGLPADFEADVLEIGEYDRRHAHIAGDLTDRQFDAVRAAVEAGYYEVPRDGDLAAVADALDCAESTASNVLRRAEASVMARLVDGYGSPE